MLCLLLIVFKWIRDGVYSNTDHGRPVDRRRRLIATWWWVEAHQKSHNSYLCTQNHFVLFEASNCAVSGIERRERESSI